MTDEISRDEDASKVVRPRFRMGLKPTALLRHTAKVRLAQGLAQNDTGRDVAGCFSFPPSQSRQAVPALPCPATWSFCVAIIDCFGNSLWRGLRFEKTPRRGVFSLLTHKESLRSRSPCYSRWQRGKLCRDRAEEVTVGEREENATVWRFLEAKSVATGSSRSNLRLRHRTTMWQDRAKVSRIA